MAIQGIAILQTLAVGKIHGRQASLGITRGNHGRLTTLTGNGGCGTVNARGAARATGSRGAPIQGKGASKFRITIQHTIQIGTDIGFGQLGIGLIAGERGQQGRAIVALECRTTGAVAI